MESEIEQLCLDTLYYLQKTPGSSSLVSNEFGAKLRRCGIEALPAIEGVMREVVGPALEKHHAEYGAPDLKAIIREGPPFSGLDEFFGAYWMICARTNAGHAVEFIKGMPRSVVIEAVLSWAIFFNKKHPLSEIALPKEYQDYLNELSRSGVPEYAVVASHVAGKLGQPNNH